MLAPICLFSYNRLLETQQTIESLKKNNLAKESELFIFSDGPKSEKDIKKVYEVREYLYEVTGFKSISIIESNENKGLANSIISGVTKIIMEYGKAIVVEDDLVLAENFLSFMNESLNFYSNKSNIFSVSGFSVKIKVPSEYSYDNYFWGRAHSWGWATWKERWLTVDWDLKDFEAFYNSKKSQKAFNKYGSDLSRMLINSKEGKVDSWFIRFTYSQFKQNKFTVYPVNSKVLNNGFMKDATHTNVYNRIKVDLDNSLKLNFEFDSVVKINPKIGKQVYKYKSLNFRIVSKILTLLLRMQLIKQRKQSI